MAIYDPFAVAPTGVGNGTGLIYTPVPPPVVNPPGIPPPFFQQNVAGSTGPQNGGIYAAQQDVSAATQPSSFPPVPVFPLPGGATSPQSVPWYLPPGSGNGGWSQQNGTWSEAPQNGPWSAPQPKVNAATQPSPVTIQIGTPAPVKSQPTTVSAQNQPETNQQATSQRSNVNSSAPFSYQPLARQSVQGQQATQNYYGGQSQFQGNSGNRTSTTGIAGGQSSLAGMGQGGALGANGRPSRNSNTWKTMSGGGI
jgi:hypothetical protein